MYALFNYVEAGLWGLIGLALAISALRRHGLSRRHTWLAAATFVAFGTSDIVDAHTGAWWRPWWLFVWKATCILILLLLLRASPGTTSVAGAAAAVIRVSSTGGPFFHRPRTAPA